MAIDGWDGTLKITVLLEIAKLEGSKSNDPDADHPLTKFAFERVALNSWAEAAPDKKR